MQLSDYCYYTEIQTLLDEELQQLKADLVDLEMVLKARAKDRKEDTFLPVNLKRKILEAKKMFP